MKYVIKTQNSAEEYIWTGILFFNAVKLERWKVIWRWKTYRPGGSFTHENYEKKQWLVKASDCLFSFYLSVYFSICVCVCLFHFCLSVCLCFCLSITWKWLARERWVWGSGYKTVIEHRLDDKKKTLRWLLARGVSFYRVDSVNTCYSLTAICTQHSLKR